MNQANIQEIEELAAIVSGSEDNASETIDFTNNFDNLSVSSSSSSDDDNKNEDDENDDGNDDEPFYDKNLDDEDEDFVHRFMRGLIQEKETKTTNNNNNEKPISKDERNNNGEPVLKKSGITEISSTSTTSPDVKQKTKPLLKPRDSDAILSCPCCFTTVCMDCQQHEKYTNQYRAMFVMNIGVNWHRKMIFNEEKSMLEDAIGTTVVDNTKDNSTDNNKNIVYYYPVFCLNCGTEVASLNMDDEIYHFYGCIASG